MELAYIYAGLWNMHLAVSTLAWMDLWVAPLGVWVAV